MKNAKLHMMSFRIGQSESFSILHRGFTPKDWQLAEVKEWIKWAEEQMEKEKALEDIL